MARLFSRMKGRYRQVHLKTLLDDQVTIENIQRAKSFLKNARAPDTLVLFIAGHGVHDLDDAGTYYYLTHGAQLENLADTAISFEVIEGLLQGIPHRNKLFLMDTCESGEVEEDDQERFFQLAGTRGIKARTNRGIKVTLKKSRAKRQRNRDCLYAKDRFIYNDLLRRSGAIVFSASKGGEFSYESSKIENGYFTEEIMIAFSGRDADNDGDGLLSTGEMRRFVSENVARKTTNAQHPTVDRDNIFQRFGFPIVPGP